MHAKIDSLFSTVLWILAIWAICSVMPRHSASASNVESEQNAAAQASEYAN